MMRRVARETAMRRSAAASVALALAACIVAATESAAVDRVYSGNAFCFEGQLFRGDQAGGATVSPSSPNSALSLPAAIRALPDADGRSGWALRDGMDQWAVLDWRYYESYLYKFLPEIPRYESTAITGLTITVSYSSFKPGAPASVIVVPCFTWLHYDLYLNANRPGQGDNTVRDGDNRNLAYTNEVVVANRGWARRHYNFLGLSTSSNATEASFQFDTAIAKKDGSEPGKLLGARTDGTTNGVVVLYGVWRPREVTITLDPDGGTVSSNAVYVVGDETCPALPDPARDGFDFLGWFDGDRQMREGDEVSGDDDVTIALKARWKERPRHYSVAFDANGGTGEMDDVADIEYGVAWTLPECRFENGYRAFVGWTTNAATAALFADRAVVSNLTAVANGRVTLFATWGALPENDVTFTWVAADGAEATASAIVKSGEHAQVPDAFDAEAWTGHTFAGWSPDVSATVVEGDIAFTAFYTTNAYTVVFNANGGKGRMASQPFLYGESQALSDFNDSFARDWHEFRGWTTNADDTAVVYENCAVVSNLTATANGRVVLYAVWECMLSDLAQAAAANFELTPQYSANGKAWADDASGKWLVDEQASAVGATAIKVYSDVNPENPLESDGINRTSDRYRLAGAVSGPGTLTFKWMADMDMDRSQASAAASGVDFRYSAEGTSEAVTLAEAPGFNEWTEVSIAFEGEGAVEFAWHASMYGKGGSYTSYSVWIDDVHWEPEKAAGGLRLILR